jgi:hypothetical protein
MRRQQLRRIFKEVISIAKGFSLVTWLIGKFLAIKGFAITSIVFEVVSKVSGRRQYRILAKIG